MYIERAHPERAGLATALAAREGHLDGRDDDRRGARGLESVLTQVAGAEQEGAVQNARNARPVDAELRQQQLERVVRVRAKRDVQGQVNRQECIDGQLRAKARPRRGVASPPHQQRKERDVKHDEPEIRSLSPSDLPCFFGPRVRTELPRHDQG